MIPERPMALLLALLLAILITALVLGGLGPALTGGFHG